MAEGGREPVPDATRKQPGHSNTLRRSCGVQNRTCAPIQDLLSPKAGFSRYRASSPVPARAVFPTGCHLIDRIEATGVAGSTTAHLPAVKDVGMTPDL